MAAEAVSVCAWMINESGRRRRGGELRRKEKDPAVAFEGPRRRRNRRRINHVWEAQKDGRCWVGMPGNGINRRDGLGGGVGVEPKSSQFDAQIKTLNVL